ncbi:hypothetical protein BDZ90DRAFT_234397 [Jaminaea rosea]|uniref:Vacuolar protein sorting-associated protein 16 homolog n=1 Tax=Jaminaea rosea TaxID=1569628 RepID=A0A316UIR2_9BASI|nr:hypothetical protein BDZ90DRAFT_234397 [Jaminaea rosea]PWN25197.1 hypothetical protein BDZ90DRAFT_234397 [Jaminaea rosea]
MPPPHPFLECSPLASVFYRKRDIYSLAWGHSDLSHFIVAAASNGGYVALTRDPRRLIALGRGAAVKPKVMVYTAAGQLVESIPWDPSNRIAGIGFSSNDELAIVLDEGILRLYTLQAPCPATTSTTASSSSTPESLPTPVTATCFYTQHSLGQDATETGVVEARIWQHGVVALTGGGRFVDFRFPSVNHDEGLLWDEYSRPPQPQLLPHFAPTANTQLGPQIPTAWSFVPPTSSASGVLEILLSPPPLPDPRGQSNGTTPPPPAYEAGTLLTLDSISACTDARLSRGPFSSISPSPNGKLLALVLQRDKKLWVVSADFQRSLSEFDLTECEGYQEAVQNGEEAAQAGSIAGVAGLRQAEWCGNNTVALAFTNASVVLVGPFGDSIVYNYSETSGVHLVAESDGVRVLSADRHELIQKVHEATAMVFRPGSSDPAALLLDASEQLSAPLSGGRHGDKSGDKSSTTRADEALRAISSSLPQAVDTCITAASHEWEPAWQRRLLRAAALGKSFLDAGVGYDSTRFVETSRRLRVLNAVRAYEIGVPASWEEFAGEEGEVDGMEALVRRLTARNHHLLALRIAEHLRLRPDAILKHWARAKIARSTAAASATAAGTGASRTARGAHGDDAALCSLIVRNFTSRTHSSVSYSSIASWAYTAGRVRLATRLLDHEPRAVDQVPLLLKMSQDRRALEKSVESGDTDLVWHVLLKLKAQLGRGEFFRVVQRPWQEDDDGDDPGKKAATAASRRAYASLAVSLLEVYARDFDPDLLRDLYFTDDRRLDSAILDLEFSTTSSDLPARQSHLSSASKLLSEDKAHSTDSKLVDEASRLLAFQAQLEKEDGGTGRTPWAGLSLHATLRHLFVRQWPKKAEKLRSDFKVSERAYQAARIDAAVSRRDWDGLWALLPANGARPSAAAGGYEAFVIKLVQAGQTGQAMRYVERASPLPGSGGAGGQAEKGDKTRLRALLGRLPPNVGGQMLARLDGRGGP